MSSNLNFIIKDVTIQLDDVRNLNEIVGTYNNLPDMKELVLSNGGNLFPLFDEIALENGVIQGILNLPLSLFNKDIYDFSYVVENWLDLLSELKIYLKGTSWKVTIDDMVFQWDNSQNKFTRPG